MKEKIKNHEKAGNKCFKDNFIFKIENVKLFFVVWKNNRFIFEKMLYTNLKSFSFMNNKQRHKKKKLGNS